MRPRRRPERRWKREEDLWLWDTISWTGLGGVWNSQPDPAIDKKRVWESKVASCLPFSSWLGLPDIRRERDRVGGLSQRSWHPKFIKPCWQVNFVHWTQGYNLERYGFNWMLKVLDSRHWTKLEHWSSWTKGRMAVKGRVTGYTRAFYKSIHCDVDRVRQEAEWRFSSSHFCRGAFKRLQDQIKSWPSLRLKAGKIPKTANSETDKQDLLIPNPT